MKFNEHSCSQLSRLPRADTLNNYGTKQTLSANSPGCSMSLRPRYGTPTPQPQHVRSRSPSRTRSAVRSPITDRRGLGTLAPYVLPGLLRRASMGLPNEAQLMFSNQRFTNGMGLDLASQPSASQGQRDQAHEAAGRCPSGSPRNPGTAQVQSLCVLQHASYHVFLSHKRSRTAVTASVLSVCIQTTFACVDHPHRPQSKAPNIFWQTATSHMSSICCTEN